MNSQLPHNLSSFIWHFLKPYKFVSFIFVLMAILAGFWGPFNSTLIKHIVDIIPQVKNGDIAILILPITFIVLNFIYYKIFNIDMVYFFKKVYFIRGWQAFISVLMTLIIFSGYSLTVSYFFKIGLSYLFFWMILELLIQYANKHKMRGAI